MFGQLIEEVRLVVEGGGSRRRKVARQDATYRNKEMVPTYDVKTNKGARHSLKWSHNLDQLKRKEQEHDFDKKAVKKGHEPLSTLRPVRQGALRKGSDARADLNKKSREHRWRETGRTMRQRSRLPK
jgi:hypothetical protein